jgi:serine/threonine-protein kinase
MERMYGETLSQRLLREKRVPLPELVAVMMQVLDALASAHARGIVHRDIAPGNVFLVAATGPGGEGAAFVRARAPLVKILDFGFSKLLAPGDDEEADTGLTGEGMVVGTPHYMSPEQIRGDKVLDPRCDLFSTGAVMYRAATGERPFAGPTMNAVLQAILSFIPRPPSEVRPELPRTLDAVIAKATQRDKTRRYSSAAEFRHALEALGVAPPRPAAVAAETSDLESGDGSIDVEFSTSVSLSEEDLVTLERDRRTFDLPPVRRPPRK